MEFGHDTAAALEAAVDLANRAPDYPAQPADVRDFYDRHQFTGRIDETDAEVASIRALQPQLRTLLLSERDSMATAINTILRTAKALPQLVRHDALDWHVHAVPPRADLATRIQVETAVALIDVLRADELSRISLCALDDCEGVVLDFTRNRSRRFCSAACGNRAAVAAYRARKAASASSPQR